MYSARSFLSSCSQVETIVQTFATFKVRKTELFFDNAPPLGWPLANAPPWERSKIMPNKCPEGEWAGLELIEPYIFGTEMWGAEHPKSLFGATAPLLHCLWHQAMDLAVFMSIQTIILTPHLGGYKYSTISQLMGWEYVQTEQLYFPQRIITSSELGFDNKDVDL